MSFLRAIATVGGMTMLSRITGFARDALQAALLGAGPAADIFVVALRLPSFFRSLFAEGAFMVSFVPLFSAELKTRGKAAARRLAEEALALMVLVLLPFVLAAMLAMPWIVGLVAPGFADEPGKLAAATELSRVTFPYLLLVSLTALMGGVLNSVGRFGPFAAAPVAFNLTLTAALLLAWRFGVDPGWAMAWGITLSGVIQVVWLAWCCRREGLSLRLPMPRLTPRVEKLFRLMGPGAVGAGVVQINLLIGTAIASLLPSGAVSMLYYADRLNQLPLGVIGIAIGSALLPLLSAHVAAGDLPKVRHYLSRGMEFSLLLGLPAAVALFVIPGQIVGVLFERGQFGADDTAGTAAALAAYAIGIPAYVASKVLASAFFARHDTRTPVKVALVTLGSNTLLAVALMGPLGHVGIALATGLTSWVNVALLARGLARQGHLDLDAQVRRRAPRILVAAIGMGGALFGLARLLHPWLADRHLPVEVAALGLLCGGGLAVYGLLLLVLRGAEIGDLRALLRRRRAAAPPGEDGGIA